MIAPPQDRVGLWMSGSVPLKQELTAEQQVLLTP